MGIYGRKWMSDIYVTKIQTGSELYNKDTRYGSIT